MATVVLPRSLVALFPRAERRLNVAGSSVAEVIAALDGAIPGIPDRLLAPGPTIREHLNVFVDGERAALDTPVGPDAVLHVIPAVSGG